MSEPVRPESEAPDAQPLFDLVRRTARVLRLSWIGTGAGHCVALFLGLLGAVTALDMVFSFGVGLRCVGLVALVVPIGWVLAEEIIRPACRGLAPGAVARRIEAHIPRIYNRLVSCIDLALNRAEGRQSAAFYRRLVGETLARVALFRPGMIVDRPRLRRAGLYAGAAAALCALLLLLLPDRMPVAVARIFAPFADIPPATGVGIRVEPGDTKVLRGDEVVFRAALIEGDAAGLRLELRGERGGKTLWYDLRRQTNQVWTFTLTGFEESFHYRVHGGGTWTRQHKVDVLQRPSIVELHTVLRYPEYMGMARPLVGHSQTADVAGPVGSIVEVVVQAQDDVARGSICHVEAASNTAGRADADLVTASFPMTRGTNGAWVGRFPLVTNGLYRVKLQNELGHANPIMSPGRFTALDDSPPRVTLERPGVDLVISQSGKVPLVIAASDDYGLDDVCVVMEPRGDTNQAVRIPARRYAAPQPSEAIVTTLDMGPLGLNVGEYVRYRVEARDRKGQKATTKDFFVRVGPVDQSIDRRLADFDEGQDALVKRLAELSAAQQKVKDAVDQMASRFEPAVEQAANAAALTNAGNTSAGVKLDAETLKAMEEVKNKLADTALAEQQNAELARQFSASVAAAAEDAARLPLMPSEMAEQMKLLRQAFDNTVLAPMERLTSTMQAGSRAGQVPPDLNVTKQVAARVQDSLAELSSEFANVARATSMLRQDPNEAVAEMQESMMRTQAGMMAHELRDLDDMMAQLLHRMADMEGQQRGLVDRGAQAREADLPAIEAKQTELERQVDPVLDLAEALQSGDRMRQLEQEATPPGERDAFDQPGALSPPEDSGTEGELSAAQGDRRFTPALGGPPPKTAQRSVGTQRPEPQAVSSAAGKDARERRAELESRGGERLEELGRAQASVSSDSESLDKLGAKLDQALAQARARGAQRNTGQATESANGPADQLAQLMQSPTMQAAMAMAGRLQQMQGQVGIAGKTQTELMRHLRSHSQSGGGFTGATSTDAQLAGIDADKRSVILNLQPQVREELLQGMKEEGPAAYRKYIQNYFEQLTKVKNP